MRANYVESSKTRIRMQAFKAKKTDNHQHMSMYKSEQVMRMWIYITLPQKK